ncbi:hypothetical protein U27_02550 [Candidatus Vecturithrix granuli]|uniref:Uncharacterized protein n=1 Tax=Vecturithrix granuli TaxID=1499967 RepID=A0A081CAW6_VECG1|nr:hypothetical protein U27_02550 [Candidatus Vecturithrix granuli]
MMNHWHQINREKYRMSELARTHSLDNQAALQELKSLIVKKYSEQIDQLLVFGSQIDGTAREYNEGRLTTC